MTDALLIHGGAVGDFVMSLRVVAAMREAGAAPWCATAWCENPFSHPPLRESLPAYPHPLCDPPSPDFSHSPPQAGAVRITVLGKPEIASIAVPGGGVDAVIDLNQGGYHMLFSEELTLPPLLLEVLRRFDLAVDMLGGPGGAPIIKLRQAGIPRVIAIDPRPRPEWPGHISDQWLADLRAAGIQATPGPPLIRLSDDRRDEARRRLREAPGGSNERIALLHPGSGSHQKCWPPAYFVELARTLQARGWAVMFLLGHVEMERFSAGEIAMLRAAGPTISDRPLRGAADLIAAADLFIGNDSGMSHLAAALGTPTVAIFGPTDPNLWRPLGEHVICVGPGPHGAWPNVEDVVNIVSG